METLPIWIFSNLFRPNQAPDHQRGRGGAVVVSIVPIYLAQRLSSDTAAGGRI